MIPPVYDRLPEVEETLIVLPLIPLIVLPSNNLAIKPLV